MHCTDEQLSAYHDGHVYPANRGLIESHLASCAECSAQLAELRLLSHALNVEHGPGLSQIARHRLHDRLNRAMDRGLIRFAASISGIAAAILVAGSIWLVRSSATGSESLQSAPPWVEASTSLATRTDTTSTAANSPAARWYLADASTHVDEASLAVESRNP